MKIIGFDPGFDRLGVALIEKTPKGESLIFSECFLTDKSLSYEKRLLSIGNRIDEIITLYSPEKAALEDLFLEKNQKTAMKVAGVCGLISYICAKRGMVVKTFSPLSIKQAVAGYGKSDKKQVIYMVEKLLSLPAKKRLDDEYDAIAVALTLSAESRFI